MKERNMKQYGYDEYKFYVDGECYGSCNVPVDNTDYDYCMDASFIARETKKNVDIYKNGMQIDTV
jgi:hypothetical protein